jgi:hypothetical protein
MRKSPKTTDGVNLKSHASLTPLISALLLAGIKLALEEKKRNNTCKTAKAAKISKAAKPAKPASHRRKTI